MNKNKKPAKALNTVSLNTDGARAIAHEALHTLIASLAPGIEAKRIGLDRTTISSFFDVVKLHQITILDAFRHFFERFSDNGQRSIVTDGTNGYMGRSYYALPPESFIPEKNALEKPAQVCAQYFYDHLTEKINDALFELFGEALCVVQGQERRNFENIFFGHITTRLRTDFTEPAPNSSLPDLLKLAAQEIVAQSVFHAYDRERLGGLFMEYIGSQLYYEGDSTDEREIENSLIEMRQYATEMFVEAFDFELNTDLEQLLRLLKSDGGLWRKPPTAA